MKNNFTTKSVSQLTILAILNFLAPPTWASGPKEEMPELEKAKVPPPLPPKNNWMDAQTSSKTIRPSKNNKQFPIRARSATDLPLNKSLPSAIEDNTPEPTPPIPELQQGKEINSVQRISSQGEENTTRPSIQIPLIEDRRKPEKTFFSLRVRGKRRTKTDPAKEHATIPKPEPIEQNSGPYTQKKSAKISKWRHSINFGSSSAKVIPSFGPRQVPKRNEVDKAKDQSLPSELIHYIREVENENPEETFKLGQKYYIGKVVTKNEKLAVFYFKKAAKAGHPSAQYALGHCYDKGKGITQNIKKAKKWTEYAAQNGNAPAQYRLANYFYHGIGASQNKKQAKAWYLEAAKQGHLMAQVELGAYYLFDEPVENVEQKFANEKEALYWLQKAAEQENKRAITLLEELNKTIEDRKKSQNEE